jgi:PAS domain S-box-containing protein
MKDNTSNRRKKSGEDEKDYDRLIYELKRVERQNLRLKKELIKKTEHVREEQDKYDDFYNLAPVGFITLNNEGIIKEINLAAAELMDIDKKTAEGSHFIHYLQTDSINHFNKMLYESKYTYNISEGDISIVNQQNELKYISLTVVPFVDYTIKKISYRIFFHDITENRRIGRLLYESENRFKLISEATPVVIWMTDINGRFEYMNRTGYMFLGINEDKMSTEIWLETWHPDDKERFSSELMAATKEYRSFSMEIRVRNYKGAYRWVINTAVPRFLENGSFVGLIGSTTDIDEEKNIRISLKKSLDEKEMLMREVHHRVKNNLQLILSLINLQSSLLDDKKMIGLLKTTEDRIKSMATLHDRLYMTNNIKWVNTKEYLNELITGLSLSFNPTNKIKLRNNIHEKNITVGLSISLGLIINELFTNALKYAFPGDRKGEVIIELRPHNDHELYLMFKDNGVGFPKGFEMTNSKSFGLLLISTLVEQHGGTMKIINNGCTEFHIILPYNDSNSEV